MQTYPAIARKSFTGVFILFHRKTRWFCCGCARWILSRPFFFISARRPNERASDGVRRESRPAGTENRRSCFNAHLRTVGEGRRIFCQGLIRVFFFHKTYFQLLYSDNIDSPFEPFTKYVDWLSVIILGHVFLSLESSLVVAEICARWTLSRHSFSHW